MTAFRFSDEELFKLTLDMVSIPSYPGIAGREQAVAAYIKDVFDAEGIECWIDRLDGGRANIYALLRGSGGGKRLMLNGHMDTVPPYDMEDACKPKLADGRIYGRGSADMKGPLAAAMAALIDIKRSGIQLAGDLLFAAVADEEEGSLGCTDLIQKGYTADGVVVCEPSGKNNIYIAQKGLEWYEVEFLGRTVHGASQDRGVNAILKAVHFIEKAETKLRPQLDKRTHPLLGSSTMNIAVIHGGTQPSTVAGRCVVQLDRRFLPKTEPYNEVWAELSDILCELSAEDRDFNAALRVLPESVMSEGFVHQGFETDPDDFLVRCAAESCETVVGGKAQLGGCPCWTDGGLISHYLGIPTIVWGPGSIELCHSKDEYIDTESLSLMARAYAELAKRFCV